MRPFESSFTFISQVLEDILPVLLGRVKGTVLRERRTGVHRIVSCSDCVEVPLHAGCTPVSPVFGTEMESRQAGPS